MTDCQPYEVTNLDRYGSAPLPWTRPHDLLANGALGPEVPVFLGTAGADGVLHAAGIGVAWLDGDLYLTSGPQTRKSRHLASRPACTISIRLEGIDLVLEGEAAKVTDRGILEQVAGLYRAGGWPAEIEGEPLVSPTLFSNRQMTGGLLMFFFQYMVMMGIFFVIPLYLSVALGLSAIETGVKITPLSITMLLGAAGIPRFFPAASPRRVVEASLLAVIVGLLVLISTMDVGASAQIVTIPLLLIGLGMGGLASQLGSVTVSSVPNEKSPEVGGLQNTATQFGASLGTALAGSVLVAALTASFLTGIAQNPAVPKELSLQASVELAAGIPFVSDIQLESALQQAGLDPATTQAVMDVNEQSRLDGLRAALALLVLIAVIALFFTRPIPRQQPSAQPAAEPIVADGPAIVPTTA